MADQAGRALAIMGGIALAVGVVVALLLFWWVLPLALLTLVGLLVFVLAVLVVAAIVVGVLHLVLGPYYFVTKRRPAEPGDYRLDDVGDVESDSRE